MNGVAPVNNWTGLFSRGEKVRLRFINGSAMSIFDVRIPGLKLTVIAADGQDVEPVTVDEFRISTAETNDVIVEPADDRAYTIFAQSIDRSGFARGTLAPQVGMIELMQMVAVGLRLRYEIRRELAPYVGLLWERRLGGTADLLRAAGRDASDLVFTAGLTTPNDRPFEKVPAIARFYKPAPAPTERSG